MHGVFGGALLGLQRGAAAAQISLILQGHVQLIPGLGEIGTGALQLVPAGLFGGFQLLPLFFQLFQLVGTGEKAAAADAAAAGHGAAGMDHLPVQGDDAQAVSVVAGHADGIRQGFGNNGPAKQVINDLFVAGIEAHKLGGNAHKAGIPHRRVLHHGAADGVQRQEGCAAGIAALEHFDGKSAVVLAVDDDVLSGCAKGCLDGEGAFLIGAEQICHRAVDAADRSAFTLPHDGFHRAGVALVFLLHIREHADASVHAAAVHLQAVEALGKLPGALFPGFELHAAAFQNIVVPVALLFQAAELLQDLSDPGFTAPDAGADLLRAALLLLNIPEQTFLLLHAALAVGLENGDGGFTFGNQALGRGETISRLLALDVLTVHALGQIAGGGIERFQLALGLLQVGLGLVILQAYRFRLRTELVQRGHPGGDFHNAQFIPQNQIAFGGFGLGLEGSHLHFQFLDLIADAEQVFLGLFQLVLRLFLAVTVAGDTGGFLKNFTAVGALAGDDLRNTSLADDGISVPAEARIHEKTVDILEANRLAVDGILAFPAAVITAGQHDLRAFGGKDMGGVIQDQRNLGKAERTALLRAAEDHVLHLAAAQRFASLLAHDPKDRIGNIRFTRAVWPDDGCDVFFKADPGLVREGLEALDLQCFQIQCYDLIRWNRIVLLYQEARDFTRKSERFSASFFRKEQIALLVSRIKCG